MTSEPYTSSFMPQPSVRERMAPLLFSENDTARLLAVPRSEVRRLVCEGKLAVVAIGGYRRIVVGSILAYVSSLATAQSPNKKSPAVDAAGPDTDAKAVCHTTAACQGRLNGEVQCTAPIAHFMTA